MNEVTIEVRKDSLSIQGPNIKGNVEGAKKILKTALEALEKKPAESFTNEIVYKP